MQQRVESFLFMYLFEQQALDKRGGCDIAEVMGGSQNTAAQFRKSLLIKVSEGQQIAYHLHLKQK